MRRTLLGIAAGLACLPLGGAEQPAPPEAHHVIPYSPVATLPSPKRSTPWPRVGATVDIGWQTLDLEWRSGDASSNPPFTSHWRDIEALVGRLTIRDQQENALAFRIDAEYGGFIDGDNRHSGFTDDRSQTIYRSDNASDYGHHWRLALEGGGNIHLGGNRFVLTPLMGFTAEGLLLTQRHGDQVVPDNGPYDGLLSDLRSIWLGPGATIEARWRSGGRLDLRATAGIRLVFYDGVADWNLRTDLEHPVSLDQRGRGQSFFITPQAIWAIGPRVRLVATGRYEELRVRDGDDRVRVDGGQDYLTTFHITARTWSIMGGVDLEF